VRRAANRFYPVANLGLVRVASLTVGRGELVSILMTARSVALSMPMTRAGRPDPVCRVGGKLHEDFVGLLNDVVIGDDVAFESTIKPIQRLAHLVVIAALLIRNLAAEELVEEVLEVS